MSVKITGQRQLRTANNTVMLGNATEASFHLKMRFEPEGNPSLTVRTWVFGGDGASTFGISYMGAGSLPYTVKTRFTLQNLSGSTVNRDVDLAVGSVYTLGLVFSATTGHRCYVNGQRFSLGTLTGSLPNHNVGFGPGYWQYTPAGSIFSVEDLAIWEGYALTDQQINDLRDSLITPASITNGTWRGWWTMNGTPGNAVVLSSGGLLNSITGNTGGDFPISLATGTGTAVYGEGMAFEPSAEVSEARIGTSGRTLFVFMRSITTASQTTCKAVNSIPTMKINGNSIGPLTQIVANGNQEWSGFLLPSGTRVVPGDDVTISASANWMDTVAGAAAGMTDATVVNHAGESCFRGPDYVKTLRIGVNTEYAPIDWRSLGHYMKNIKCRLGKFGLISEWDANGKPITFAPGYTTAVAVLYQSSYPNGIDDTGYVGPTGLYAVGWDDTNPVSPTTFKITARDAATTVVTPRPEYDNPGAIDGGGVRRGIVKVFEVTRAPTSTSYSTALNCSFTNMAGLPRFENLIISHEKDFTVGTPTVLDNSNPFALSEHFKDIWKGAGSIRCWTSLLSGVTSSIYEREHNRLLTDFTWSIADRKTGHTIRWVQADPFSIEDTPYIYYTQFGEKYGATLSVAVSSAAQRATDTFTIIKDAGPGNEIIIGSRLFLGDEICRVDEILPDNQYTVTRGIDETTPTSHSVGPIQVGFRAPMINPGGGGGDNYWFSNGHYVKLTSQNPHRIPTGFVVRFNGTSWPTFDYIDGNSGKLTDGFGGSVVTGPNTIVVKAPPWHDALLPGSTLASPVILDPAIHTSPVSLPSQEQLPYGMHSKAANQLDCPTCFYALPLYGTDDCYYWIAKEIRDNLDTGRLAYIELGNEEWNFYEQKQFYFIASNAMYPGQTIWATYITRYKRVREIFEEVWGERATDLRFFINQQAVLVRSEVLNFAKSQDPPIRIDAVATAPYHGGHSAWIPPETQTAWANYEVDEILDVWIHTLWYGIGYGARYQAAQWLNHMATYTDDTGFPCELVSYEGGIETMLSSSITNYVQKERDMFYHPNMYIIGQDFFANLQEAGYKWFNYFCSFDCWFVGRYMWGIYKHHYHDYGRGDGSDGKANNLLCLAVPGKTYSKLATVNQDATNVSTLGAAWRAWNDFTPAPPDSVYVTLGALKSGASSAFIAKQAYKSIAGVKATARTNFTVVVPTKRYFIARGH